MENTRKQKNTFTSVRGKVNKKLCTYNKNRHYRKDRPHEFKCLFDHVSQVLDCSHIYKGERFSVKAMRKALLDWVDDSEGSRDDWICILQDAVIHKLVRRQNRELKSISRVAATPEHAIVISNLPASKFYISPEWRSLRYKVLSHFGNYCQCCGASPKYGTSIHVDHIKPRSVFPELALDMNNLQVLCEDCNLGKSNKFQDDWR